MESFLHHLSSYITENQIQTFQNGRKEVSVPAEDLCTTCKNAQAAEDNVLPIGTHVMFHNTTRKDMGPSSHQRILRDTGLIKYRL